ncbi:hypothetical protein B4O97_13960 [Marispirochaeta aestuarii]|uniref:Uncharacterized protein n=1 Tax=Marispirochaeta aestuarii TaxID=1963862 RepID=A0A1Y1RVD3_9SPIO|nr:hypothetical protein [Marispirochaeta aestuarii]ORC33989.1 hypothetical protein B4O97_13960 [Marispirochaeta aestuarii]
MNTLQCNTGRTDINHISTETSLAHWPLPTYPRLDTCLISIPLDTVNEIELDSLIENTTTVNGDKIVRAVLKVAPIHLPYGVRGINIEKDQVLIELSAKILQDRYFDLINRNTIELALHRLNECPSITLNINKVLDSARAFRCDSTTDIWTSQYPLDYIAALRLSVINPKYRKELYGRDESVVYLARTKSRQRRLIVYWKYPEMLRDRKLSQFLKPTDFFPVIRIEHNLKTFQDIRAAFKIKDICLADILNSQHNPNIALFNRINPEYPRLIDPKSTQHRFSDIEKQEGRISILKKFDYDLESVKAFIRANVKGNTSAYTKRYIQLKSQLFSDQDESGEILIRELKQKIISAWRCPA